MLIVLEHLLGRINLPGMWWIIAERWLWGDAPQSRCTFCAAAFLRCLTCLSIGKKCLHLGSFDDRIKMLQYAQKRGVQEGKV